MMENVCEACGAIVVKAIEKGKLGAGKSLLLYWVWE